MKMDLSKYGVEKDNKILETALTHSSYAYEEGVKSYERLEYLGDAVLELIISEYYYKNTRLSEGEMSKKRSSYVCEEALACYAKKLGIDKYIKVGHGLLNDVNDTIIADVFEAVIATIYLNSGLSKAREFVLDVAVPFIEKRTIFLSDYKSYLQELVQTTKKSVVYKIVNETGPSHDKTFEVEVIIEGIVYGKGIGKNKKEAEQNAAKDAVFKSVGVEK